MYAGKGKDCKKRFCESFREHTMGIINFKKKKMRLLTNEQQKWYKTAKICYIFREKFEYKYDKDKKYNKVRDHLNYTSEYRGAGYSRSNLKYHLPKEILIVFHKASNNDYYFTIKALAEEGENTKKIHNLFKLQ